MTLHDTRRNPPRSRRWVLPLVQVSFLGLFIALHPAGVTRIWLFILIAGFIASPFVGRVYCRAVCPVNTFNRLAALLPGGMRLRKRKSPGWLAHPVFRAAWFSILLATLVIAMIMRMRFHLFTIVTVIGIILCRVFPAAVWCNGLCPWGALLQCGARHAQPKPVRIPSKEPSRALEHDDRSGADTLATSRSCEISYQPLDEAANVFAKQKGPFLRP
jgi:hypothetical protein